MTITISLSVSYHTAGTSSYYIINYEYRLRKRYYNIITFHTHTLLPKQSSMTHIMAVLNATVETHNWQRIGANNQNIKSAYTCTNISKISSNIQDASSYSGLEHTFCPGFVVVFSIPHHYNFRHASRSPGTRIRTLNLTNEGCRSCTNRPNLPSCLCLYCCLKYDCCYLIIL